MKKYWLLLLLAFVSIPGMAQNEDTDVEEIVTRFNNALNLLPITRIKNYDDYKLYPTENIYNFLKLDTKTGKIDLIQWSLDDEKEFAIPLNTLDLSNGIQLDQGAFELYPTKNMYQFLLLNKFTGQVWHVQWGFESSQRWIKRIEGT